MASKSAFSVYSEIKESEEDEQVSYSLDENPKTFVLAPNNFHNEPLSHKRLKRK